MTTEEKIKRHTEKLESGQHDTRYCQACAHCGREERFRVHQCRRRSFRIVVNGVVRVFRSWVLRLKCPRCRRTFSD